MNIIKTKDFILRPTILEDHKAYFEMHNEPEARKNFHFYPKTLAEAKKEIQNDLKEIKSKKNRASFTLVVDDEVAGFFWLMDIVPKHKAIIGFGLIKKFRGRGLGTAGLKAVTKYAFKKYDLVKMETGTRVFNKGARRILEKTGYKLEGILKKHILQQNGSCSDECLYGLVK
jgi:ribosomal-protein-alanine N-acetyltransferase